MPKTFISYAVKMRWAFDNRYTFCPFFQTGKHLLCPRIQTDIIGRQRTEKLSSMYGKGLIGHDPFFLIQFFKHFPDLNLWRCPMRIMPVLFQRLFQRALTVADKCRIALLQFLRFINGPVISKTMPVSPQFWKIFLCVDIHQCPVQIKHIIVVLHRQHGFLQIFSHVNFPLL